MHRTNPKILHISADFPDNIRSTGKPRAISNLLDSTPDLNHTTISINKNSTSKFTISHDAKKNIYSIRYPGLPFSLFHRYFLHHLAQNIEKIINIKKFDIIHAHKLSIESIIANYFKLKYNKKMIITIRGATDIHYFKYKILMRPFFKNIIENADHVFFLAPWTYDIFKNKFNINFKKKYSLLPNIVSNSLSANYNISNSNYFITALRFETNNFKSKNIYRTTKAFDVTFPKNQNIKLFIIGKSNGRNSLKFENFLHKNQLHRKIKFLKKINNDKLCKILNHSIGFIRPSINETFGMVYLESLYAGVPILHAFESGIDGYFTKHAFIKKVNPYSITDISQNIQEIYENQILYKKDIVSFLKKEGLSDFSKQKISSRYNNIIYNILYK